MVTTIKRFRVIASTSVRIIHRIMCHHDIHSICHTNIITDELNGWCMSDPIITLSTIYRYMYVAYRWPILAGAPSHKWCCEWSIRTEGDRAGLEVSTGGGGGDHDELASPRQLASRTRRPSG